MNRCFVHGRRVTALLAISACLGLSTNPLQAESARSLFNKGVNAEAREDFDAAYRFYDEAWRKSPKDDRYKASAARMRPEAALVHVKTGRQDRDAGDNTDAVTEFLRALAIDPSLEIARQEIEITRHNMQARQDAAAQADVQAPPTTEEQELNSAQAPIELKPISNEPLTLHLNQDSKIAYETIGKQAGLNVLFDADYTGKNIQVDLTNTTLYDALRVVGAITGTFWKPITPNTIYVAADTRAKRTALDQQAVRTFYLTNPAQQQDLTDIQTALRNVLGEGPKFYNITSQNAIIGKGTPDQLLLAEKIIDDLDKARPEVLMDVAVMEISKDKLRTIGIQLPGTIGVQVQPSSASTTSTGTDGTATTTNLTLNDFRDLNATNFGITISSATANLLLSDSDTRILQNPRIRASDGQKATLKIGSRIPVATGSYQTSAATTAVSGLVNTQFQYLDIGVNIEATPIVHYDRDVTIKLKIEVLSEAGNVTISGVTEPIIGQNSIEHTIRLKEGEANILGGILTDNDTRSAGGWPGLGELPILKYLFSARTHEVSQNEIVFIMTPHVVRAHELSPLNLRTIDTGTGTSVELRRSSPVPVATGAADATPGNPANGSPIGIKRPFATNPATVVPDPREPGLTPPASAPAGAPPPAATLAPAKPGIATPFAPPAALATPPAASVTPAAAPGAVALAVTTPGTAQTVGSAFSVKVDLSQGADIFSVPLELHYDPAKLMLINVDAGDLLARDGQAVALVHRDDGKGTITINASRPPGVKGISGTGSVCTVTFVAKAAGDAEVSILKAMPRNSDQQTLVATVGQGTVHIQ